MSGLGKPASMASGIIRPADVRPPLVTRRAAFASAAILPICSPDGSPLPIDARPCGACTTAAGAGAARSVDDELLASGARESRRLSTAVDFLGATGRSSSSSSDDTARRVPRAVADGPARGGESISKSLSASLSTRRERARGIVRACAGETARAADSAATDPRRAR